MISVALPSTELLESIKIETGYASLRNIREKIKILAADAEKELGYSNTLVTKKVLYDLDDVNWNGKSLWLPKDCHELTTIYDGDVELNNKHYWVAGNYVYFVEDKEPTNPLVIYEALTFDGFGWPLMTRSHKNAITAYVVWKLFVPRAFQSGTRADRVLVKDYEQDWNDQRDSAIGNDAMPGSQQEWNQVSDVWNMSLHEIRSSENCILKESYYALEAKKECVLREVEKQITVYHWQYLDRLTNIDVAPGIDISYLESNTTKEVLVNMIAGKTISYVGIGRIAFAIQNIEESDYHIYDILNGRVDNIVFDSYYNEALKLHIFISKEFYSHSNIFFKFLKS